VLIGRGTAIQKSLADKITPIELADRLFAWLLPQLPSTLSLDEEKTQAEQERVKNEVEPVKRKFLKGQTVLAKAGEPINDSTLDLLTLEHEQIEATEPSSDEFRRNGHRIGLPGAVQTERHQVVHQVVLRGHRVEDAAHMACLLAVLDLRVAEMGLAHQR
jgi:hypothetical protein